MHCRQCPCFVSQSRPEGAHSLSEAHRMTQAPSTHVALASPQSAPVTHPTQRPSARSHTLSDGQSRVFTQGANGWHSWSAQNSFLPQSLSMTQRTHSSVVGSQAGFFEPAHSLGPVQTTRGSHLACVQREPVGHYESKRQSTHPCLRWHPPLSPARLHLARLRL